MENTHQLLSEYVSGQKTTRRWRRRHSPINLSDVAEVFISANLSHYILTKLDGSQVVRNLGEYALCDLGQIASSPARLVLETSKEYTVRTGRRAIDVIRHGIGAGK